MTNKIEWDILEITKIFLLKLVPFGPTNQVLNKKQYR